MGLSVKNVASALVLSGCLAGFASAAPHSSHPQPGTPAAAPSTKAFEQSMITMHEGMAIKYTGDADVDFVRGMIPHHQGAVDMAKIELEYGKDPDNRKLAEEIIASQEKEIAVMQAWLKAHGR